ncbi:hypothetical protein NDU88_000471 [Pleurodeles waltl]|uniref:Uncharacterized protein n=1 Tax=Pleurodeles waltl TaxID=8319 RepID=A0AAV7P0Z4_PLEWA|nr:hypothetical protein NDU88_000471 [Pleurodeles waltl]
MNLQPHGSPRPDLAAGRALRGPADTGPFSKSNRDSLTPQRPKLGGKANSIADESSPAAPALATPNQGAGRSSRGR